MARTKGPRPLARAPLPTPNNNHPTEETGSTSSGVSTPPRDNDGPSRLPIMSAREHPNSSSRPSAARHAQPRGGSKTNVRGQRDNDNNGGDEHDEGNDENTPGTASTGPAQRHSTTARPSGASGRPGSAGEKARKKKSLGVPADDEEEDESPAGEDERDEDPAEEDNEDENSVGEDEEDENPAGEDEEEQNDDDNNSKADSNDDDGPDAAPEAPEVDDEDRAASSARPVQGAAPKVKKGIAHKPKRFVPKKRPSTYRRRDWQWKPNRFWVIRGVTAEKKVGNNTKYLVHWLGLDQNGRKYKPTWTKEDMISEEAYRDWVKRKRDGKESEIDENVSDREQHVDATESEGEDEGEDD